MKQLELIIMVGLPGSGKSTVAQQLNQERLGGEGVILSSDEIRKELFNDESCQTDNNKVFTLLHTRLVEYLKNNVSVIVDATNTTLKTRKQVLEKVSALGCKTIAYVVNTTIPECLERDSNRQRQVGQSVLRKFELSYQHPQKFEGFDEIIIHSRSTQSVRRRLLTQLRDTMDNFNQQNYHHIYTLGKHCRVLANNYQTTEEELTRHEAGLWHDVGKLFTQHLDEDGVAHYYSHDSVGTYFMASHPNLFAEEIFDNIDKLQETLFYINYHMRAHNDFRTPKAEKKYRALFGDTLYDKLIEFAEFDKIASGTDGGKHVCSKDG